ncbi:peptidase [Oleiphilus sp. HI0125]|uniref:M14 family metallopeptidase n=1 Tax=Oleiphilus sp. HI0125 TaxID=1822266 RepID=UPI0007C25CA6|nr:M14 family metallocarboxypeptidase [Oleiphilus sp. HI0125]KZZ58649.1 peptidase [Oleiphilus sp. HI0125]
MAYAIGTPGQPWGESEIEQWRSAVRYYRSYQTEVVDHLYRLSDRFHIDNYGSLSHDPIRYSLFAVKTAQPNPELPWVLITGGVHGYETSGVLGALSFLVNKAEQYEEKFNLVVIPCVSPWGFETINRWNYDTIDPNRSFKDGGLCEEAQFTMQYVAKHGIEPVMHIDLHETTDTDATEFRPALAAKLGQKETPTHIPDGFYLVGDSGNPQDAFQARIIAAVESVTHIAPNDEEGCLLGDKASQHGVVNYDAKLLGLCAGFTSARFTTTTEVYPDSESATREECIAAQVVAVEAALEFVSEQINS